MTLPDDNTQLEILRFHSEKQNAPSIAPVMSLEQLREFQEQASQITVSDTLQRYLLALCQAVRSIIGQDHTVSTRATLALQRASQAVALLDNQTSVLPDHVQKIFPHVLRHRLLSEDTPDPNHLLSSALEQTPVP